MAKNKLSDSEYNEYFNNSEKRNKKGPSNGNFDKRKKLKIIIGSVLVFLIVFVYYIISGMPSLEELENPRPSLASKVYSIDGELIGQYFIENRIETNIDSLPKHLITALIATEDRNFYNHWGVDLFRFVKAMIKNVFAFSREGASTITQQLAKNLYDLKGKNENIFGTGIRKIREWLTAIQLERSFTKKEILEMYLNVSYFGRSAYGIETAAKVYFNKKAANLTLPESALFIAMLKSPENYDPVNKKEASLNRRNLVLRNMVDNDDLTESEYEKLKAIDIKLDSERPSGLKSIAPHFMEYVRLQLEALSEKYGYNLYRDGLSIYTTINYKMQIIANKSAQAHLLADQKIFDNSWKWENNKELLSSLVDKAIRNSPSYRAATEEDKINIFNRLKNSQNFIDSVKKSESTVQLGFVAIDPRNGQIRAMVGGQNQNFGRGLNHVTGIRRQAGSSFKPIVYATALENGCFPQYSLLNEKFNYNGWSPNNSSGGYGGYMTLRNAIANSVNIISGRLTTSELAPPSQVISIAKKMGINSPLGNYPSIALGTSEITPLELTSAFGTFVNKGVHYNPISILKIEDREGNLIAEFTTDYQRAISPQTAVMMTSMMEDVINYGTGGRVKSYFHKPAAGKTGTTQNFSDAWFIGFTPQLLAGVWVGFDDHRLKFTGWYGQGSQAALPVWGMFMRDVYSSVDMDVSSIYFNEDVEGLEHGVFCLESILAGDAKLAGPGCSNTVSDFISTSHSPGECTIHNGGGIQREEGRESNW